MLTGPAGSEFLDGRDDALPHQVDRVQRADPGEPAVRDREAELGQLVQVLDRVLHPLAVLAEIERDLHRLLDRVVITALSGTVLTQHVQLVRHTEGGDRLRVALAVGPETGAGDGSR